MDNGKAKLYSPMQAAMLVAFGGPAVVGFALNGNYNALGKRPKVSEMIIGAVGVILLFFTSMYFQSLFFQALPLMVVCSVALACVGVYGYRKDKAAAAKFGPYTTFQGNERVFVYGVEALATLVFFGMFFCL